MDTLKECFDLKVMNEDIPFSALKVGDRVWSRKHGLGKITEVCAGWRCIKVNFDNEKGKGGYHYRDKGYPYDLLGDRIEEDKTELYILVKKGVVVKTIEKIKKDEVVEKDFNDVFWVLIDKINELVDVANELKKSTNRKLSNPKNK